ncbi:MAG: hypothetical protein LBL55_11580 [Propionibacteriaceae bacterium]|jgi:hypothetical protein|nr:hypothetical protein [Propionibacteriaceae bacterium]
MTAQLWRLERLEQPEAEVWARPRLRVIEGRAADHEGPAGRPAVRAVSVRTEPVRPSAGALTRRGRALARCAVAILFSSAGFTIVWSFLQVSNAPLP